MAKNAKVKRNRKTKSTYNTDYVFSTVADLEVGSVPIGSSCVLLGYYEPGDFGQPIILISETADGGIHSYIFRDGGFANLYQAGPLNVLWYGAYKDGTNASITTAAIQDAIDAAGPKFIGGVLTFTDGKTVFFPAGDYATNATILVQLGVTLVGETPHPGGVKVWEQANHGTKIRPSTTTIAFRMRSNSTIQNMVIQHSSTNYGDQQTAIDNGETNYATLKAWANNGIAIGSSDTDSYNAAQGHAYGCCIRDCIIAGFNWAINFDHSSMSGGRYRLENLLIDCWNGVNIEGTGDICRIRDVHLWPLLEQVGSPPNWRLSERGGIGIKIERGGDWAQVSGSMVFGYQTGLKLVDANMTNVVQFAFDGSDLGSNEIRSYPVRGIEITGDTKNTIITNYQSGGHPTDGCNPIYINVTGNDADSLILVTNSVLTGFDDEIKVEIDNAEYVGFTNCAMPAGKTTFKINADMGLDLAVNNCIIQTYPTSSVIENDAAGYTTNNISWNNNIITGSGTFQIN